MLSSIVKLTTIDIFLLNLTLKGMLQFVCFISLYIALIIHTIEVYLKHPELH